MLKADLFVVGAGPAGLGAAIEGARCGASVLMVDENRRAGGQLYKQIHKFFGSEAHHAGARGFQIAELLLREAEQAGVRLRLDARALGLLDDGTVAVLSGGKTVRVEAGRVVLATGAKENALAFPGWTLPGVMTAGAAQTFSNVHGTLVGERIVTVGTGNVGLIVSYQLMQAGAEIAALVEAAPQITGYLVHAGKLQRAGVPIYTAHTVVAARGAGRVSEVDVAQVDSRFAPIPGTTRTLAADTVLLAVGLNPRAELSGMFQCRTTYEGALGGLLPLHDENMRSSNPRVYVCGDLAGVEEASTALEEGRIAGLHAALSLGFAPPGAEGRLDALRQSLDDLRGGPLAERRLDAKNRITKLGGDCYAQ